MFLAIIKICIICLLNTVMKKMKHRIVEHMSSSTADALGLSRAILCNGKFYDLLNYENFQLSKTPNLGNIC